MDAPTTPIAADYVGIGLYTAAEAARLLNLAPKTIQRWLRGYLDRGVRRAPMWHPQIPSDEEIYLGFRDLQELRVAAAFIQNGLSTHRIRQAIDAARHLLDEERPLSTKRFRTDGRSLFLQIVQDDGQTHLIDLFRRQYAFCEIVEQSLSNLDYDDDGVPLRWWPRGHASHVVLDPARAFGQPIESETSVPVAALVMAAATEGSPEAAAKAWDVPIRAVRRALAFERDLQAA